VRVAVFQSDVAGLDLNGRLDRLSAAFDATSHDLVVCPELFLSGYNVGDALTDRAEPVTGPMVQAVCTLARETQTALVCGYPERNGDTIYNSAVCVAASGEIVANHRKLVIPPGHERDHFACGTGRTVFNLNGVRCAMLVCYDVEFPEAVRDAALAGADLVIAPTALGKRWLVVAEKLIPTRAFENNVWLAYANHAGEENGLAYFGGSCIVAPDGTDAARAGASEELISATIDPRQGASLRDRLPYLHDLPRLREALSD